ncbi:hypothetical protein [Ruegeria intermedia]|uniref:hypothetical protein n=1 Tax=Ruegeria intermedia TaxID=996115 RepID=UPI00122D1C93|nr:hypothetical protein [Ruegeria intermedia]
MATGTTRGQEPVVWLHIGHGKTGTTALQKYFVARAAQDPAFHYPAVGQVASGAHHALFPLETQSHFIKDAPALLNRVRQVVLELPSEALTMLSSEHMCYFRPWQVAQVRQALKGFDVRILYFARRQDDLIESTFKWKLVGEGKRMHDVDAFVDANFRGFDFLSRLAPWRAHFGDAAIHACLYHSETCARDIVSRAEAVLGTEWTGRRDLPKAHRRSLSAPLVRALIAYDRVHEGRRPKAATGIRQSFD